MRNPVDSMISFFSPVRGLKRAQSRLGMTNIQNRNFDIASKGRRNNGWFRPDTSGAQEASKAFRLAANSAQELTRNNPLALRIKHVWSANTVGQGIQLDVTASSDAKSKRFFGLWDSWAESTDCDFEGHNTLYGLQTLWMETVVESGGVFIRKHVDKNRGLQLQTIEQTFLDNSKNGDSENGGTLIDGIEYNEVGKIIGYWFNTEKTNTKLGRIPESKFHSSDDVIHIFRKDRVGQHIGVTWYSAIATILRNYDTYQDAKLMQQQISACFALFVEDADGDLGSSDYTLPDAIEPAMIEHVKAGQKVTTVTPPKADSSNAFDIGIKRDISLGVNLTYEQLTGDYSLVNFASGRMGKSEFFSQLDKVQHQMLKPKLNTVAEWFSNLYEMNNGSNNDLKITWTFPPRAAVNPMEELDVLAHKVRFGFMSPSKAAKQLGEKLPEVIAQWTKDKAMFGKLPFDIDPSLFAKTGNQLNTDDAASGNAESGVKPKKKEEVKDD